MLDNVTQCCSVAFEGLHKRPPRLPIHDRETDPMRTHQAHPLHADASDHVLAASTYAAMTHRPETFDVELSYLHFRHETMAQWYDIIDSGLSVEFHDNVEDPYGNESARMFEDIARGHLWTYRTQPGQLPTDHPMAAPVFPILGILLNDIFRAVHDVNAHNPIKASFGPSGEYAAWLQHRERYSYSALAALWCETRGQSAWTNFTPGHESLPLRDRPFATQKAGLVPARLI